MFLAIYNIIFIKIGNQYKNILENVIMFYPFV